MMELEKEDRAYLKAIERNWPGHYIYSSGDDEAHFVNGLHSPCESCGSTFGGDREKAVALPHDLKTGEQYEIEICVDCLMFHANGDLPENWSASP